MTKTSVPGVSVFHAHETGKHHPINQDPVTLSCSLKALAAKILERLERKAEIPKCDETAQTPEESPFSAVAEAFEERLAIAEYDGGQEKDAVYRIAYQDAFIQILNALADGEDATDVKQWLHTRIQRAQEYF